MFRRNILKVVEGLWVRRFDLPGASAPGIKNKYHMLIILSPAKNLDFSIQNSSAEGTEPIFRKQTNQLVRVLKKMKPKELEELMNISPKLALSNYDRFLNFNLGETPPEARQAMLAFKGDVYLGLQAGDLDENELHFAQDHVRILSGLYGVLRPLDLIQPYRLEMGLKLSFGNYKNLYDFWGRRISNDIKSALKEQDDNIIVNLASNEYFKSINPKQLKTRIITPGFLERREDGYKMLSVFAKKARGMMTRFVIKNGIQEPEEMKLFDYEGYMYNDLMSEGDRWVFTRG
jgi:cytoplasmic iron level regulating protein YaaA (DUF328/UPF0246 family)